MIIINVNYSYLFYNQMSKQLLIILKLFIAVSSLCSISTQIPQLSLHSANIINMNLSSTSQEYAITHNNTNASSFALTVKQMDFSNPNEWNISVRGNGSNLIIRYSKDHVNWIKISCIIIVSSRNDIFLGSSLIEVINTTYKMQTQVSVSQKISNFETSVVIIFLNGFKINYNKSIQLKLKPFQVGSQSFMVNITSDANQISYIRLSYIIFSPHQVKFEAAGDYLQIKAHQYAQFFDVSQQIPNTPYKIYGISGIKADNPNNINFGAIIDQDYALASQLNTDIVLEYLYFLPEDYSCSDKCNTSIVINSTCNTSCPNGTVLINNGQIVFCRYCPESLYLVADKNQVSCICQQGYEMNNYGKCQIIKDQQAKEREKDQSDTNCSSISNSISIDGRCSCKIGFTNLSNNCVPIVSIGSNFLPITVAICSQNQSFSNQFNKCICNAGYQFNLIRCVSICSNIEFFNSSTKTCICNNGYTRINSKCVLCPSLNQYSFGNEVCYTLSGKQYCRNNYILINNTCVSCSSIDISIRVNGSCSLCQNGFVYNGSQCICQSPRQIINQTCTIPSCGNRKIDSGQTCDDGNSINGDGCSSLCLIQQNYFCSGIPSICRRTICGNGALTGGQQCDDNNTSDGDGCSSLCLVQEGYTCVGPRSFCYKISTGNLTLISIHSNTNNIFLIFQTPKSYVFPNAAFMQTFMSFRYLTRNIIPGIIYCQQQIPKLNRFNCLIIFPNGIPITDFIVSFSYNYDNTTGAALVYISNGVRA